MSVAHGPLRFVVGALAAALLGFGACCVPIREEPYREMTVVDNAGVEHEIRMFYRWPLIPFVPHFYVEMGNERWVVHRGGFGYADNAHVYMSPDQRNVVVAKQFEGSATVFVRFDIASETGIVERGHPRDYHDKGWKRVEWQRRR